MQKPPKPKFDEKAQVAATLAAVMATMKPRSIEQILHRENFNTTGDSSEYPVSAALTVTEEARKNFERYMLSQFGLQTDPSLNMSWVRGIAFLSGFALNQASMILKFMRPSPDPLGVVHSSKDSKLYETWTSQDKLAVVAVEMFKLLLGFYQATRFTHAVATTSNENDPYPEFFIRQDDEILKEFYEALNLEIPEFSTPDDPKVPIN